MPSILSRYWKAALGAAGGAALGAGYALAIGCHGQ